MLRHNLLTYSVLAIRLCPKKDKDKSAKYW